MPELDSACRDDAIVSAATPSPFTVTVENGGENMNRKTLTIIGCIALGALLYVLLF